MCYFGPGYQSLSTIVHELGHYYSFFVNEGEDTALDFAEVQSQGNEMMLLAHMMSGSENNVIRAFASYQISNMLMTTIICCIIDEFEQYVYTHEIVDPVVELDPIITQITATYEVSGFDMDEVTDMTQYWRMVVIESPVSSKTITSNVM